MSEVSSSERPLKVFLAYTLAEGEGNLLPSGANPREKFTQGTLHLLTKSVINLSTWI